MDINQILKTEYCESLDEIVTKVAAYNRICYPAKLKEYRQKCMATSYYKYGKASLNYPKNINALESSKKYLKKYRSTKNMEYLADVMNFIMLEWMHPRHQDATLNDNFSPKIIIGFEGEGVSDVFESQDQLIDVYNQTGDKRYLIIIMVIILGEFNDPQFENAFFRPTDAKESPGVVGMGINEAKRFKR